MYKLYGIYAVYLFAPLIQNTYQDVGKHLYELNQDDDKYDGHEHHVTNTSMVTVANRDIAEASAPEIREGTDSGMMTL